MSTYRGNVLFLSSAAYPLGGVASWLQSILISLTDQGWNCQLALTSGQLCDYAAYRLKHHWQNTIAITNPTGSREGRIQAIHSTLRKEHPDYLVVINTPDAYLAASRMGNRRPFVIMALHGIEPQFYRDIDAFGSVIDAVVVPSQLAKKLISGATDYSKDRAFQIPAGVDNFETQIAPPLKPLNIVYVGRLTEVAKRVQDIPEIFRELDRRGIDYEFTIAGDGPLRIALETDLKLLKGKVRFLGALSKTELFEQVYIPGRVLLLTSEYETGPLVVWEAMSAGLAVVTSDYLGLAVENVLQNEINALVFPVADSKLAAEALRKVQDENTYIGLVTAGKQLVRELYLVNSMAGKWSRLLEQISKKSPSKMPRVNFKHPADGRLSKLFGHYAAEWIRKFFHREYHHSSAGGEWPHSYSSAKPHSRYLEVLHSSRPPVIDK